MLELWGSMNVLLNSAPLFFVQQRTPKSNTNLERRLLIQLHLQRMQLLCMLLLQDFIATAEAVLLLL